VSGTLCVRRISAKGEGHGSARPVDRDGGCRGWATHVRPGRAGMGVQQPGDRLLGRGDRAGRTESARSVRLHGHGRHGHLHSLDQWPGGRERPGERCDRLGQFCDAGPRKPGTGRQYRRQRHGSRCPVSSRPNVPDLRDDPIRATDCPGRFEPEPSDDTGVAATAFLEHFGAASASQRRAGSEPSGSG